MGEGSGERPSPSDIPAAEVGLVQDLWRTKCWRLFPLLTSYVVCLTFLMPLKPALMTGNEPGLPFAEIAAVLVSISRHIPVNDSK